MRSVTEKLLPGTSTSLQLAMMKIHLGRRECPSQRETPTKAQFGLPREMEGECIIIGPEFHPGF